MLIDTHAHIHFDEFKDQLEPVFELARKNQLDSIISVGVDDADSRAALNFVLNPDVLQMAGPIRLYATAGIHPHEASLGEDTFMSIKEITQNQDYEKVLVAIGECGLDYFKNFSSKQEQLRMLEWQLELATQRNLPVVFHIRDAWEDFFAVLKNHTKTRGVVHSFTGHPEQVELAAKYDLYFGLNGIMTFTKDQAQLEAAKLVPDDRLLLETDCPYLAPVPFRGQQNQPAYVSATAKFLAELRETPVDTFTSQCTTNSKKLFNL